jgi:hypothetical protein
VLKMMPNKTDQHDARGLTQIVRTGWFKVAQTRSHEAYVNRAMLTAREARIGMRVKMENESGGCSRPPASYSESGSASSGAGPGRSSKAS